MTHDDTTTGRWSLAGQLMAWVIAAEGVLAITAISSAELHRPRVLVAAAAVSIASAVLAARARMPVQAKAGLVTLVCVALLALAAAQDPFGLRAIDHRIEDAARESSTPDAQVEAPAPSGTALSASQVTLHGKGDASAVAFADDLARSIATKGDDAGGAVRVDGVIDVSKGASGDTYRLTWSLGRQAETLWCGRIVAVGQGRDAVIDSFSTTIAAALRRARSGTMACS